MLSLLAAKRRIMKVTIYSTTTCSFCHALKQWLDSKQIDYINKVTDTDEAAMVEFMGVNDGMLGVPFTVIESDSGEITKIVGFDKQKLESALSL